MIGNSYNVHAIIPYNYTTLQNNAVYSECPDDAVFKHVSRIYSDNHRTMHEGMSCKNPSQMEFPGGITNGNKWYPVVGGMQVCKGSGVLLSISY